MKKIIDAFLQKERKTLWDYFDLLYAFVIAMFLIACGYELIQFFIANYTFGRVASLFIGFTLVYLFGVFQKFNKTQGTVAPKVSVERSLSSIHPYMGYVSQYKDTWFYAVFLMYLVVFVLGFFVGFSYLLYATYILLAAFVLYKIVGGTIHKQLQRGDFEQKTFLKILVLSLSVFVICIGATMDSYGITEHKTMTLLWMSLLYIAGFTYSFSDIFTNVGLYFHSRKFRNIMVGNTYNFLSFFFIGLTVVLLLAKFGFFTGLGVKILSYFEPAPAVVNELPRETDPVFQEPVTQTLITKSISDIFEFDGFSTLGSTGPEVIKLQESLNLLGYYDGELSGDFDEATRDSLIETLIEKCEWPDTTKGIFGPLAQECLYSLDVQFDVTGSEAEVGGTPAVTTPISDEAEPLGI